MKKHTQLLSGLVVILAISCSSQDEHLNQPKAQLSKERLEESMTHDEYLAQSLTDSVEAMAMQPDRYTWKDIDKLYVSMIQNSEIRELKNVTLFHLFTRFDFIEKADAGKRAYYLKEIDSIDFNTNLKYVVTLLNSMSGKWSREQIATYANRIYTKNTKYWNDHFPGKTKYLELNKEALEDLKELSYVLK